MSIVAASTAAPTSYRSVPTENPDIEFERWWTAWEARGLAHERTVRRRFLTVIVTAAIAVAALFAYKLLSP